MPRIKKTEDGTVLEKDGDVVTPLPSQSVYRALREFSAQIGGTLVKFQAGDLINDYHLITQLRAHNSPIVPDEDAHVVICPNCKHIFSVNIEEPSA